MSTELSISALTRARLPHPLAELCWLFSNLPQDSDSEKLARLKEIFEVLVKLSASVAVSSFLSEADRFTGDPDWNKLRERIESLSSPSLGHWVGTLRDVVGFFAKRREDVPESVAEMIDYLSIKFPGGRNSPEFDAMATLAAFKGSAPDKPTVVSAFDLLVSLRNKVGSGGHGAHLNPVDTKRAAVALEIVIASLLKNAIFFKRWTVIFVETVEKKRGQTVFYETRMFDGIKIGRERLTQESGFYELCVDGECYFVRLDDSEGVRSIQQAVPIKPYVIYQTCPFTKTDQLFFFNEKKRNGTLEYLCYVTGAPFNPLELDREFDNISKVMRGEVRASDVFRPMEGGGEKIPSPDERRLAESTAHEAIQHIRGLDAELALRRSVEALKIDPNCALAQFSKGLAHCDQEDIRSAKIAFSTAAELSSNEPSFLLAKALIHILEEASAEAYAAVRMLQRMDPTNQLVAEYLRAPDLFSSSKFGSSNSLGAKLRVAKRLILQQLDDDHQEIVSWLFRLPPWKQLYQLATNKRFPIPPLFSSLVGSILLFMVPILAHLPSLQYWGYSSESISLICRHGIVAAVCFCGFYYVFCINRFLRNAYINLGKSVMMPRLAFRHWFMSEVGNAWGAANSEAGLRQTTKTSEVLSSDRRLFLLHVVVVVAVIPIQFFCSGDYNRHLPYPSELATSLSAGVVNAPNIPPAIGVLQFLVRHLAYYVEIYLCVYSITFMLPFARFFPRLLDLPIRYFPGVPDSLTLKTIAKSFVGIAWLGLVFCILVVAQLIVCACYSFAPLAAMSYVVISLLVLPLYMLIPAIGIFRTMNSQRDRVIEEFSGNIERSYTDAVAESDEVSFSGLRNKTEFVSLIKRNCPTFPLTMGSVISSIFIMVVLCLVIAGYFYVTIFLGWPKF